MFFEQLEDTFVSIERRIFAHQFYNRLLITHIFAKRKPTPENSMRLNGIKLPFKITFSNSSIKRVHIQFSDNIVIKLDYQKNYDSDDFNFDSIVDQDGYRLVFIHSVDCCMRLYLRFPYIATLI